MGLLTKRSTLIFLSDPLCPYSHRVRLVLAEKGVTADIHQLDPEDPPRELADINPYNSLPTLVDRELVLYEPRIIMEYLEERFPHPPLLPVHAVGRAESRQYMHRIERDWGGLQDSLLHGRVKGRDAERIRKELRESLLSVAPIFGEKPYFMSEEFSLVDCCMATLLWRLPAMGVELPDSRQSRPLQEYMQRLFLRPAFRLSLTPKERALRPAAKG